MMTSVQIQKPPWKVWKGGNDDLVRGLEFWWPTNSNSSLLDAFGVYLYLLDVSPLYYVDDFTLIGTTR